MCLTSNNKWLGALKGGVHVYASLAVHGTSFVLGCLLM